jgi:hypothetical protein
MKKAAFRVMKAAFFMFTASGRRGASFRSSADGLVIAEVIGDVKH